MVRYKHPDLYSECSVLPDRPCHDEDMHNLRCRMEYAQEECNEWQRQFEAMLELMRTSTAILVKPKEGVSALIGLGERTVKKILDGRQYDF